MESHRGKSGPHQSRRYVPALLVLASIGVALLIAEGLLRLIGFSFHTFPTVQFGWPQPSVIAKFYIPDRDLFWVPPDYLRKLSAARDASVVFLGDSCTEFGGYPELVLQQLARDRPELATGVALGVAGWSSEQGRAQFMRDVMPLRPAVVTVYFGWNDHWVALGPTDAQARPGLIAFWISQNLRLAQLVTKASLVSAVRPVADRPNRVNIDRYRENLTAMVTAAHSTGIRIVLVTAPSHHVPGAEPDALAERHLRSLGELIPQHRAYIEATRLVASQVGAKLCDVAAGFDQLEPPADQYFQADGIHLSKAGDRALAGFLTTCIVEAVDGDPVSGMGACGPSRSPEQPCSGVQ